MPSSRPPPPPSSLNDATLTPLATASFISVLTYAWLTPMMTLGYQRALQAPDLWRVRAEEEAAPLSKALDEAWERRLEKAKNSPRGKKRWFGLGKPKKPEKDGPSLAMALNDALGKDFWIAGTLIRSFIAIDTHIMPDKACIKLLEMSVNLCHLSWSR